MNYKPNIGDIISFNNIVHDYLVLPNDKLLIINSDISNCYKRGDIPDSGGYSFFKTRTDFTIYSLVQDMGI